MTERGSRPTSKFVLVILFYYFFSLFIGQKHDLLADISDAFSICTVSRNQMGSSKDDVLGSVIFQALDELIPSFPER